MDPVTIDLPLQTRQAPVASVDAKARTAELVFSAGATVRRSRWAGWDRIPFDEVLTVSKAAVNMERMAAGAPVLDSHNNYTTRAQVAVVEKAWIEGDQALARVRFPSAGVDEAADRMFALVSEGIIRNVSVGYSIDEVRVEDADKKNNQVERRIIERWTPYEVSFVTIPADPAAQVRSEDRADADGTARTFPAVIHRNQEPSPMADPVTSAAPEAGVSQTAPADAVRTAPVADGAAILAAERARAAEITRLADVHGLGADFVARHIGDGTGLDAFRGLVLDQLAARSPAAAIVPGGATTVAVTNPGESPAERRAAMIDGMVMRAFGGTPKANEGRPIVANAERSREFAGMSMLEMGAELLGIRNAHRIPRLQLLDMLVERSMLGTTDYPLLLSAAANKFLLAQYEYQTPTYRKLAVKKPFNDFKAHNFLRAGDFPILEALSETGEFRNGSLSENREIVTAATYGKVISISRQMFVNDDLSAFSDMTGAAGRRVADFENSLFWALILSASAAGPTLSDTGVMFNTTAVTTAGGHANLASSGTAITTAAVDAGFTSMLQKKSLDGIPLNLMPGILVVGPQKRTEAIQLLSTNMLATQISNINPFSVNGDAGKLDMACDAYITDKSWYLFADPARGPAFVWGYVTGFEGPRFAINQPFRQDGLELKVAEDFGIGAIDWRPAYRNPGA